LKGYGQLTYTARGGTFVGLGVDYEGKNNSYFQPPFALLNLTAVRQVTKNFSLNLGVENLLNTDTDGAYLAEPNLGVPLVSDTATGQGTFIPARINAPARQVRLSGTLKI
jgi:outer membrane receptor protein involved in Fe transport